MCIRDRYTGLQVGDADLHAKNCKGENEMNNKKLVALLLAAMMSVSTASVAFAAPEDEITKGYPDGDVWESKLYNAMLADVYKRQ